MTTMNGTPPSSTPNGGGGGGGGGGISPPELAAMLRKSADVVERKEFHPLLYQTMRALTAYAGEYADAGGISSASSVVGSGAAAAAAAASNNNANAARRGSGEQQSTNNNTKDPPGKMKNKGAFHDVPDILGDSGKSNGQASAAAASSTGDRRPSNTSQPGQRAAPAAPPAAMNDAGIGLAAGRGVGMAGKPKSAGGAAAAADRMNTPGGPFSSAASAAGNKPENAPHSRRTGLLSGLEGIRKGIEKVGAGILKDHEKVFNKEDVPFDERPPKGGANMRDKDWVDAARRDNNAWFGDKEKQQPAVRMSGSADTISSTVSGMQHQQQQQKQQPQKAATTKNAAASLINNELNSVDKPSKPCFQRPINPSSNLIANGWIDQQRRSKMRVVWKDVLASLVEGRRPGEETTLWIQRQVVNRDTGKVTGLEALHQIPMKWLEDVNYVDLYGDHRFTLKVYNIAEEFYFRTRDEQSAQSWVLTLRSARDASLEGGNRMNNAATGGNGSAGATDKRQKDLGLHDLDDWDNNKGQGQQGGQDQQQQSQAGNDGGAEKKPSPNTAPQQQSQPAPQPQPEQAPVRMKISELRAIAHGAGYNTRGMERQDLERIAAHVRSGQYNGNQSSAPAAAAAAAAAPAPATSSESVKHSLEQEAAMREAEQRAAAVHREKEQAEEARLQKREEERAAVENMRKERELAEKNRVEEALAAQAAAADQQRRRNEQFEAQAADIKRQQEEERVRKMTELQAQERARQAQAVQQQAAAEREQKLRAEEEQRRRQYQQQQPARGGPGSIPSPPTSGNYPQQGFQQQQPQWSQQQQQHYQQQQWQQHQQQQQAHYQQQQGFPGQQQQAHPQHAHQQQFFNQNVPAGAYQQQQHPQQQQQAHYQQQQHHQQQQPPQQQQQQQQAPSKYAKQMEEKTSENEEEQQSALTLQIKRSILINWALQPPNLNVLRPIDQLITTIHTAMPPAFGVTSHAYFAKFTPIAHTELVVGTPAMGGNHPDETKLKKAVRKVRVFLHPDKLPRDLTTDQQFTARMLWDITSDSWEEFQKHKDELDWIRS